MSSSAHGRRLTDVQLAAWHRDGFLVLDQFIEAETIAALRAAYDEILAGTVPIPGDRMLGEVTRQVVLPSEGHPLFARNPAVDNGLEIARQVLGTSEVARTFDMLIYKPPGHPYETPWHQDLAYTRLPFAAPGTTPNRSIQFWVPLDDVDDETGCMRFVPGQHRQLLAHHVASGAPNDHGRLLALADPESQLDLSRAVVAELAAGGCTMHASATPHYTGPNRTTDRQRRSYIFNVAPSPG